MLILILCFAYFFLDILNLWLSNACLFSTVFYYAFLNLPDLQLFLLKLVPQSFNFTKNFFSINNLAINLGIFKVLSENILYLRLGIEKVKAYSLNADWFRFSFKIS